MDGFAIQVCIEKEVLGLFFVRELRVFSYDSAESSISAVDQSSTNFTVSAIRPPLVNCLEA